jgi:hypothetical protein
MGKRLGRALGFAVLLTVVVVGSACNKNKKADAVVQGNSEGGPPPGMGFGGPKGRGPIGQTMAKLFKGRSSLKDSIGQELNSDSPSWDTIQPQTKEFAELAASLSKYDPPKGSKDSWEKLTARKPRPWITQPQPRTRTRPWRSTPGLPITKRAKRATKSTAADPAGWECLQAGSVDPVVLPRDRLPLLSNDGPKLSEPEA